MIHFPLGKTILRRSRAGRVPLTYMVVSSIACTADFILTIGISGTAAPPALAAAAGYLFGIAVHWGLSTRIVFVAETATSAGARNRQKAMFLLSGLVGLSATVIVYAQACALGMMPAVSKALAVMLSFVITYTWRRYFIFRPPITATC